MVLCFSSSAMASSLVSKTLISDGAAPLSIVQPGTILSLSIGRLAETVGTYAHVYILSKKSIPMMVEASDYTSGELMGAVWVTFPNGEDKFFTREMIANSRVDFNKYAFDSGNVYEKAFRHRLVRLIKEKNCC